MEPLFENPLINITALGGLIFIITGYIMYKFPPKKINSLYGYRTCNSMKNQDRWDFAQKYASKQMIKFGLLMIVSSVIGFITNFDNTTNLILGLCILIAISILIFFSVENAIKTKFSKK